MTVTRFMAALLLLGSFCSFAQPANEVYLFDLVKNNDGYGLTNPINVSNNPGYDNQPSFTADGSLLYFTSLQTDEQTDIIAYDISRQIKTRLTESDGSEYSPTESADAKLISTIILERDGRQLLWKYNKDGSQAQVLIEDLKIGYHCWYDSNTLFSFVLGDPATLQKSDLQTGKNSILDENIGRSLHRIPGKKAISYISKASDVWKIVAYYVKSGKQKVVAETLPNAEDMAWTLDGTIIMGKDSKLHYRRSKDKSWSILFDLAKFNLSGITRVAVSPDGEKIAVVVNE